MMGPEPGAGAKPGSPEEPASFFESLANKLAEEKARLAEEAALEEADRQELARLVAEQKQEADLAQQVLAAERAKANEAKRAADKAEVLVRQRQATEASKLEARKRALAQARSAKIEQLRSERTQAQGAPQDRPAAWGGYEAPKLKQPQAKGGW